LSAVLTEFVERLTRQQDIAHVADWLNQLVALQPENRDLRVQHAEFAGRAGKWSEAADSLSKAFELNPNKSWQPFQLSAVLLQNRDTDNYRKLRSDLLQRWEGTKKHLIADRIAKASLLLPAEGAELSTAVELAELAIQARPNHPAYKYFEMLKGLAEYRRGENKLAVTVLESCRLKFQRGQDSQNLAAVDLLLAMNYEKLSQHDKAEVLFRSAEQRILNDVPSVQDGDLGPSYQNILICWILHREAAEVVMGPAYRALVEAEDFANMGRNEEALEQLEKAEALEGDPKIDQRRTALHLRLSESQKAAED
jgi:tetratricopeptide (TPR) repeat protein